MDDKILDTALKLYIEENNITNPKAKTFDRDSFQTWILQLDVVAGCTLKLKDTWTLQEVRDMAAGEAQKRVLCG